MPDEADLRLLRELVAQHDTPEKRRAYADAPTLWKRLPPTNRQIKVLRFFGMNPDAQVDRGTANSLILRLLNDEDKRERWLKYKLLTGDLGDDSPELRPFDSNELRNVHVPFDTNISDSEANHAITDLIRARRKRMWDCLNSPNEYRTPWLRMDDMDAITEAGGFAKLFETGDVAAFKKEFITRLQSYSPEIADREKRHRIRRSMMDRFAAMVRRLLQKS